MPRERPAVLHAMALPLSSIKLRPGLAIREPGVLVVQKVAGFLLGC